MSDVVSLPFSKQNDLRVASADEHVAAAAHHEAGHALVRLYFGHLIERVVVRPKAAWEQPYVDRRGRTIEGLAGCVEAYGICDTLMTAPLHEVRRMFPQKMVPQVRVDAEIALVPANTTGT